MNTDTSYTAAQSRYDTMRYNRCGRSGLMLPALSLGLWHNFGGITPFATQRAVCRYAFDNGITHFDLANNYGPPYGEAERNFGKILRRDFAPYRDELVISTKAGYDMWPGPYGNGGGKKYLVASLDQSLQRLGLEYVDIFYHHRPDSDTPLEETMAALNQVVRQGKALYVGISNYSAEETGAATAILRGLGTPFILHQPRYNMLERGPEDGLLQALQENGIGCIAFSPLAQGQLTGKYLDGIPQDSRAVKDPRFLAAERITDETTARVRALAPIAVQRGQSLAQLALAWLLQNKAVTSVLIGASSTAQLAENIAALGNTAFSAAELRQIDDICLSIPE